jgi:hypothetical protein
LNPAHDDLDHPVAFLSNIIMWLFPVIPTVSSRTKSVLTPA